jgi:predicted transposase YbfD/YdcC
LQLLDLQGALVSIDAMACQTKIAKTIIEQKGDYLLAVKGNQGNLSKAVQQAFSALRNDASSLEALQTEKQHGRIESRLCQVLDASTLEGNFSRWKGLKTLAMITSFRTEKGKPVSMEYRYYISSRIMSAEQVASAVREHWATRSLTVGIPKILSPPAFFGILTAATGGGK